MSKPRSAVNKAVSQGKLKDRMHLIPVTALTFLKLARLERHYFADRPITELGARCMLAEARRNKTSCRRSRQSKHSKGADYAWKRRPRGSGVAPKIGAGRLKSGAEMNRAVTEERN